jgi:hypothetical protein
VATIRETLEEAGVFLADGAALRKKDADRMRSLRLQKDLPAGWFRSEVDSGGWVLAFSRLARWAHWITPEQMAPRFDTRFYWAFMPEDQECRPDRQEIVKSLWVSPLEALERNLTGEVPLSPPTLVTLQQLLPYRTGQDLVEARQKRDWGRPLLPRLIPIPGGGIILEPWDRDYQLKDPVFDPREFEAHLLPAGAPFSKLWYNGILWRPLGL